MKKNLILVGLISTLIAVLCGCSSESATRIDAGGPRALMSTNQINVADWNDAAAALVKDLLASGRLSELKPKPVVLMVSRVINRTSEAVDTDMLTKQITMSLSNSNEIRVLSDDPATREVAMQSGKPLPVAQATLTGKIIEIRENVDDVKEVTYVFMLSLNSGGLAIWEGQKQLAKQTEMGSWGF